MDNISNHHSRQRVSPAMNWPLDELRSPSTIPAKRKEPPSASFDPNGINCVCTLTHDDGWSIGCDTCPRWVHGACFGYESTDKESLPEKWSCCVCDKRQVWRSLSRLGVSNGGEINLSESEALALLGEKARSIQLDRIATATNANGRKPQALHGLERRSKSGYPSLDVGSGASHKRKRVSSSTTPTPTTPHASWPFPPPPFSYPLPYHPPSIYPQDPSSSSSSNAVPHTAMPTELPGLSGGTFDDPISIEEPWTHAYVDIDQDIVREREVKERLDKLKRDTSGMWRHGASEWRGVSAISPMEEPVGWPYFATTPVVYPLPPKSSASTALKSTAPYPPVPPTYTVHTTHPIPSQSFLTRFPSLITSSAEYLKDPLNAYGVLGLPKPHVHLLGPPLNLALDARGVGGVGRFVRSGCRPNAVIRPVLCRKDVDKGGGSGKGKDREEQVSEDDHDECDTSFAIFALRDLKADEEVVLGWEWDDACVVHLLPALIGIGSSKSTQGSEQSYRLQMASILRALSATFTTCACGDSARGCAVQRMKDFVSGDGDEAEGGDGETVEVNVDMDFDSPYTGTQRRSATPSPSSQVDSEIPDLSFRSSAHLPDTSIRSSTPSNSNSTEQRQRIEREFGPLIGRPRGFRTRERDLGSGGLGGVEMDLEEDGDERVKEIPLGPRSREKKRAGHDLHVSPVYGFPYPYPFPHPYFYPPPTHAHGFPSSFLYPPHSVFPPYVPGFSGSSNKLFWGEASSSKGKMNKKVVEDEDLGEADIEDSHDEDGSHPRQPTRHRRKRTTPQQHGRKKSVTVNLEQVYDKTVEVSEVEMPPKMKRRMQGMVKDSIKEKRRTEVDVGAALSPIAAAADMEVGNEESRKLKIHVPGAARSISSSSSSSKAPATPAVVTTPAPPPPSSPLSQSPLPPVSSENTTSQVVEHSPRLCSPKIVKHPREIEKEKAPSPLLSLANLSLLSPAIPIPTSQDTSSSAGQANVNHSTTTKNVRVMPKASRLRLSASRSRSPPSILGSSTNSQSSMTLTDPLAALAAAAAAARPISPLPSRAARERDSSVSAHQPPPRRTNPYPVISHSTSPPTFNSHPREEGHDPRSGLLLGPGGISLLSSPEHAWVPLRRESLPGPAITTSGLTQDESTTQSLYSAMKTGGVSALASVAASVSAMVYKSHDGRDVSICEGTIEGREEEVGSSRLKPELEQQQPVNDLDSMDVDDPHPSPIPSHSQNNTSMSSPFQLTPTDSYIAPLSPSTPPNNNLDEIPPWPASPDPSARGSASPTATQEQVADNRDSRPSPASPEAVHSPLSSTSSPSPTLPLHFTHPESVASSRSSSPLSEGLGDAAVETIITKSHIDAQTKSLPPLSSPLSSPMENLRSLPAHSAPRAVSHGHAEVETSEPEPSKSLDVPPLDHSISDSMSPQSPSGMSPATPRENGMDVDIKEVDEVKEGEHDENNKHGSAISTEAVSITVKINGIKGASSHDHDSPMFDADGNVNDGSSTSFTLRSPSSPLVTPSVRLESPVPVPAPAPTKVKLSLKDFAKRKRKQKEDEQREKEEKERAEREKEERDKLEEGMRKTTMNGISKEVKKELIEEGSTIYPPSNDSAPSSSGIEPVSDPKSSNHSGLLTVIGAANERRLRERQQFNPSQVPSDDDVILKASETLNKLISSSSVPPSSLSPPNSASIPGVNAPLPSPMSTATMSVLSTVFGSHHNLNTSTIISDSDSEEAPKQEEEEQEHGPEDGEIDEKNENENDKEETENDNLSLPASTASSLPPAPVPHPSVPSSLPPKPVTLFPSHNAPASTTKSYSLAPFSTFYPITPSKAYSPPPPSRSFKLTDSSTPGPKSKTTPTQPRSFSIGSNTSARSPSVTPSLGHASPPTNNISLTSSTAAPTAPSTTNMSATLAVATLSSTNGSGAPTPTVVNPALGRAPPSGPRALLGKSWPSGGSNAGGGFLGGRGNAPYHVSRAFPPYESRDRDRFRDRGGDRDKDRDREKDRDGYWNSSSRGIRARESGGWGR